MPPSFRPDISIKPIFSCALLVTAAIIAITLFPPSFFRLLNYKTTDAVMSFSRQLPPSGSIVVVDLDEKSLAEYGQWPWSRYHLALLLKKIADLGAGSIGLTMILAEPDRTSPVNWQSSVGNELGYQIDTSQIPDEFRDHDRFLAKVLSTGPYALGYELLMKAADGSASSCRPEPIQVVQIRRSTSPFTTNFFNAQSAVCNLPLFSGAVSASGFLNATPDSDGILRRLPVLIQMDQQFYPSIALATLMQYKKSGQVYLKQEQSGAFSVTVGGIPIPIDQQGNMAVNFGSIAGSIRNISAADILGGTVPKEEIEDKIVLVGASASGLDRTYQTPAARMDAPATIHAELLETLLSGNTVVRNREFLLWEAFSAVAAAGILCAAIAGMDITGSAVVGGLCLLIPWLGSLLLFRANGLLYSPFAPTLSVLLNFAAGTILKTRIARNAARKNADTALHLLTSSEIRLNSIVRTLPDIVFRVDPAGCITFISQAVTDYIPERPESLIGRSIFDLVLPDDRKKAAYTLNERRAGERATRELELRLLLTATGGCGAREFGYFSLSSRGIYEDGPSGEKQFIGSQGILRDLAEQKLLEQQLLQAQKMKTIGDLAAGVAHDLSNILMGIVSYPDLLLLEIPEESPLRRKVMNIQQSGIKAAAIVQDLLTLARNGVQAREVINPNRIILEYLESPEHHERKKSSPQITVKTDLAPDLMNIKGTPFSLSKVLMNLMNNAAEAMPAGGLIRVSTQNRYLDAPLHLYEDIPEGEYVCIVVTDEGIGIHPDDLKHVFEPFYTKKKMRRSGSGLGTTVIWATIKDHGGFIDLQSRESEGTRIELFLPATRESVEAMGRKLRLEDYVGIEHILVVDDMPAQIDIASKMLSKLGYTVSAAASGEAAVDFMRRQKPDLLVLDMIMPCGMDGLETYQRILQVHPGQKAIIASGYAETERVRMLQALGAGEYVQKPYKLETIGIAVRKELDRTIV